MMKNVKQALGGKSVYVIDDLTPLDLKEKKRSIGHVSTICTLQFSCYASNNGKWRSTDGKPYEFVLLYSFLSHVYRPNSNIHKLMIMMINFFKPLFLTPYSGLRTVA